jgi:hypothetical protein
MNGENYTCYGNKILAGSFIIWPEQYNYLK